MIDEEIEKGLELCATIPCSDCFHCPYEPHGCKQELLEDVSDYINRLKANLESAMQSFTKMETLYKVKCKELEVAESEHAILKKNADEAFQQGLNEKRELIEPEIRRETAKEILTILKGWSDRATPLTVDIQELAEKYGVEVGG